MVLKSIVVDDDELSRNIVRLLIEQDERLSLEGIFESAVSAAEFLNHHTVDVIFLDVRMPKVSGMDLLKMIDVKYEVILITSEEKYAVEAFERNVRDYLVKPVDKARFRKAVEKVINHIQLKQQIPETADSVFIRTKQKLVRIEFGNISHIEAIGDYVAIHDKEEKHIIHSTMKNILAKLPADKFIRIHRSFIINLDKVREIGETVEIDGQKRLPVGASYRDRLMKRLNLL
jgi:DNA-binding LytR/AlgR family response regulator